MARDTMRIGFSLLNNWGIEDAQALVGLASRAEELGFDGKYHRFAGMKFSPKPPQKPSIPVVIGGVSRPAIRRAARLGDGWQPLGLSPEALRQGIAAPHDEARAHGRDISKIPVSIAMSLGVSTSRRYALGNDPAEILQNARTYAGLGVETLVISANTSDPGEARAAMKIIAREVLAAFVSDR